MGGPQVYTSGELAHIWLKQHGMHRAIIPIFLPGKMARALCQGGNTCPQQATGTVSWEAWLQQHSSESASKPRRAVDQGQPSVSPCICCMRIDISENERLGDSSTVPHSLTRTAAGLYIWQ